MLSFLQKNIAVTAIKRTANITCLIDKNFMTILLGCVENINASLEQGIARKFNASVKKSIFQADEDNNRVYQEVFLRNGQAGSCFGNPSYRLFDLSQLSFWPGCPDKPQRLQYPFS